MNLSLNLIKNPQKEGFDLNKSIDFKDLDSDILNLINLAYNGVKYMAKAMQINILAVSDNDAIERVIEEIKSLKNDII